MTKEEGKNALGEKNLVTLYIHISISLDMSSKWQGRDLGIKLSIREYKKNVSHYYLTPPLNFFFRMFLYKEREWFFLKVTKK